jgi:hypothetical protein
MITAGIKNGIRTPKKANYAGLKILMEGRNISFQQFEREKIFTQKLSKKKSLSPFGERDFL